MRSVKHLFRSLVGAAAVLVAAASQATLVFSVPGGIAATTIDFSAYDGVTSAGPVATVNVGTVADPVMLSFSDPGASNILGAVTQGFGANGGWPVSGGYAGLITMPGSMSFEFEQGMNFAGGFINFDPNVDGGVFLEAFDEQDNLIEAVNLSTINGGDWSATNGLFIGFHQDDPVIRYLRLSSSDRTGAVGLDNLTFGAATGAVPEPTALALVLVALAGLGWQGRSARALRR